MLMASSGVLNFTQTLITTKRFFGDDEVKEDTEWLRDYLRAARKELTTWDEYVAEIDSKHLSWSPCHTDDDFWNENARKLSDKDYAVLKYVGWVLILRRRQLTMVNPSEQETSGTT